MSAIVRLEQAAIVVAHAIVGWAICGALIGIGRRFLSMDTTLIVHAIGAPLAFAALVHRGLLVARAPASPRATARHP